MKNERRKAIDTQRNQYATLRMFNFIIFRSFMFIFLLCFLLNVSVSFCEVAKNNVSKESTAKKNLKRPKKSRSQLRDMLLEKLIKLAHKCHQVIVCNKVICGKDYRYESKDINNMEEAFGWAIEIMEKICEDESQFTTKNLDDMLNTCTAFLEKLSLKKVNT